MPKDPIGDHLMTVTCAKCSSKVKLPVKWIRSKSSFHCEGCESDIDLDNEELIAEVDRVERNLRQVMETPRDLKAVNSDKE